MCFTLSRKVLYSDVSDQQSLSSIVSYTVLYCHQKIDIKFVVGIKIVMQTPV